MTKDESIPKKSTAGPSFDRIKPANSASTVAGPVVAARVDDVQGKRALFSGADQPPAIGSVALECTTCKRRSVVSYVRCLPPSRLGQRHTRLTLRQISPEGQCVANSG